MEEKSKKRRLSEERDEKDSNKRCIQLNMSNYSPNIQQLKDSELVEIFDIGVAVKQSFTLTISENNEFIKRQMDDMKQQIKTDMIQIQNELKTQVSTNMLNLKEKTAELKTEVSSQINGVCQKVMPIYTLEKTLSQKIEDSTATVRTSLENYKNEVNQVAQRMEKPAIKGSVGENMVLSTLKNYIPTFTFTDVSTVGGKGDILVQTPDDHQFLIEVKNYSNNVPKREITKFSRDVASSHDAKVGLMFSLDSGIATKCKEGSFQLEADNGKFLIYVPNVTQQEDIMVWSVLLANELAGMNCNLKEGKAEQLQRLCENFKEQAKSAKKCRERMESMKKAMKDLEDEMKPVLEMIENAGKEINYIIKQ